MKTFLLGARRAVLGAAALMLLAACGGGGSVDVAGVGSGGSGVASGSVTGFGSVIVDGVEYDDSARCDPGQRTVTNRYTVSLQEFRATHR